MSKTVVNKVTKVVWDNGFKPDGVNIPSVTSADQGKVLAVDSNGKWVAASPAAPQSELPVYTAADEGKILKVDDQGALEWAEDDNTQYTAGDNVSIDNGVISAVDTTYTAGDNVEISAQNVISATDTTYSAGTGISIDGSNVISADSQLPSVSSADEGKVLKVDANGDWAVGTDNDTTYTAGTNVQINGNVISATDTTYTAGTNVSISAGNVISATDTTYTAGTNVQINNGVISATDTTYTAGNGITITGTSIAADDQLPSVTSADEGNVLIVDSNGDWVKGTAPVGAQDAIIVNLRRDTSNNSITITDTTYTTAAQIQTLVTDGKEVILRVEKDSTESFEFFTLSSDNQIASMRSYMILWDSVGVDDFSTGATHFNRIGLVMGTTFSYETMSANIGGSSYTAGDGIDISAQDVISSPEAVMAKESIAHDFAPMSFYPLPDSVADPSLTDGFVRLYNTKGADPDYVQSVFKNSGVVHTSAVYACIVNSYTRYGTVNPGYRILCIQPNAQGSYSGQVGVKDYNAAAGRAGYGTSLNLWQTYTSGGVNFAYGAVSESDDGYTHYEEVSTDLSACVYESDTAALTAFAALYPNLPTAPAEGDQVWKDGKLQTYTSGNWVDSDPIVEQIANAGGGSTGGIVMPDTANVIQTSTALTTNSTTYTATQDCFVAYKLVGKNGTATDAGLAFSVSIKESGATQSCLVDGGTYPSGFGVGSGSTTGTAPIVRGAVALKAGFVITITSSYHSSDASGFGDYIVYGVK